MPEAFKPSQETLPIVKEIIKIRVDGAIKGQLSPEQSFWLISHTRELLAVFKETQTANANWAEGRFETLRHGGDWSTDLLLVNKEGRLVTEPLSTYSSYLSGENLPPDLNTLIHLTIDGGQTGSIYPITPFRDKALFWLSERDELMKKVLENVLGGTKITDYPINPKIASLMPDMVHMIRIPREDVGRLTAARQGVITGRLGFWASREGTDQQRYIPRVYIDRTPLFGKTAAISSLDVSDVIRAGGLPMDEKHGLQVARINQRIGKEDFIAASLAASCQITTLPVALRFTTFRPWVGEAPHRRNNKGAH